MEWRFPLFLFGCIGTRSALTYLVWKWPEIAQRFSLLFLVPVIGWLWILFVRPRDTGPEVFGGKIWWNNLRLPHAGLWALTAWLAYHNSMAWKSLAADTLLGLGAWSWYHFAS